jgi:hypothetical protein
MELGVANALTRNRTVYAVEQLGWYKNIHTMKRGAHIQSQDSDERWTLEMPCWLNWYNHSCYQQPWKQGNLGYTSYGVLYPATFDQTFSAACWYVFSLCALFLGENIGHKTQPFVLTTSVH